MNSYVLSFQEIDKTKISMVGGKGANLGELSRITEILVPEGFCVTTEAYKKITENNEELKGLLDELSHFGVEDIEKIREISSEIRKVIEGITIPEVINEEIARSILRLGEKDSYAVRSSATAEDLPTASFAGQQDTYLNIIGKESILKHIRKCLASLFTERAVIYRIQNGFDHNKVHLSVVVQKMIFPKAAGILFTADPITCNRKMVSIDASFGLGEALVSGLVNADNYRVRNDKIVDKKIFTKKLGIYSLKDGGTEKLEIEPEMQNSQVLTDEQILRLTHMGRKIEEHFGCPQDIEWCLANDTFYIVQSRPITTLYPVPEASDDGKHVYLSVGHQQMMTDPLKPLGMSLKELISFGRWFKAGGRFFVDVAPMLASPDGRKNLLNNMKQLEPLTEDAIMTIIERDFIKCLPNDKEEQSDIKSNKSISAAGSEPQKELDTTIVSELIKKTQSSIEELKQNIKKKSGVELIDFILEDINELKRILFDPQSTAVFMSAINASLWINEKMNEWLGEKNAADILSQSVPNNITSEMGLELMDVADVIRPYLEIVDFLQHVKDDNFLEEVIKFHGGKETRDAILSYLRKFGMRCSGEIDITRTRFSEKPITLVPMILSNIKNFEPSAGNKKFEQGRQEALNKEQELLSRLRELPDGEEKAKETKRNIDLIRNFIGYREYPKYGMISRYFVYKQALMKEAERLVQDGVIHKKEDIYYLILEELREVVYTNKLDYDIIMKRKEEHKLNEKLTPPRVMTSDGEIITGKYKRENIPAGAIPGLPVSSGFIEGRARVILNMEDAVLEAGDILVTSFTDPSWTPLFVSIKGLVTEIGGLMTHGAVIAREYGLPAVVGVEDATKLIKDGEWIRVNGTEGYVEIL
ncbi:phosphoenolpyruvate synthase [Clostridium beijerinckii]|uniref:phosphoenolpyruvate synthase n=1 Tax=Clostridium beijerinckii TaxID=1520 RepID=UPI001361C070|nr:phosphoenolpyruvate synthase [Clostridium beijerinckii]MZK49079.1 phosphoenolpyruvate synthase [Clostridium beijerinckii]MZK56910.1 phosphoenolpyruvate synthase [Clostridium beijerinckii]MZK67121.1 phosphoenolpyruvate synthase [Clostridium beijerinckii]MZK72747.1 phosphoenolpyruvate synthase [Clostridium beijerinckii]MZK82344.1 phosphoenolpyruvate synthase [Clostridium beijerinckii]